MNVKDYGKICSKKTIEVLKKSIFDLISNKSIRRTYWLPIDRDPKNNIENFVIKTFNLYFSEIDKKSVAGFEWWFHTQNWIGDQSSLHFDCDEDRKRNENIVISPLGSTITYLTNTKNGSTFITNVETTGHKTHFPKLPTEIVYSYPGEGKFIIFDSKYLHGTDRSEKFRLTLLYNVWHYRIGDCPESSLVEDLFSLEINKNEPKNIETYNGDFEYEDSMIFGIPTIFKKPSKHKFYDSHHVNV